MQQRKEQQERGEREKEIGTMTKEVRKEKAHHVISSTYHHVDGKPKKKTHGRYCRLLANTIDDLRGVGHNINDLTDIGSRSLLDSDVGRNTCCQPRHRSKPS